jgi:hypothetical protein
VLSLSHFTLYCLQKLLNDCLGSNLNSPDNFFIKKQGLCQDKIKKSKIFKIFIYKAFIFVIMDMVLFCGLERTPTFLVPIINPPFADNSPHPL